MKRISALIFPLLAVACSSDDMPTPADVNFSQEVAAVSEYHEKIRTKPYPLAESTIYVNPAPLIVPQAMKTGLTLQFQLSPDSTFLSPSTITSSPRQWCFYSPHRSLAPGIWYWRFRNDDGEWSRNYSFSISGEEDEFATPAFATFIGNAPRRHPRLYCFADAAEETYRANASSHPEYRRLTARAESALSLSLDNNPELYRNYQTLMNSVMWLSDAYMLTADNKYADKLLSILSAMLSTPPSEAELYSENFATSSIAYAHAAIYDLLYSRLSEEMRAATEDMLVRILERFTLPNIGYQENHIFDNHFWQQNMRVMFQTAFVLYDNPRLEARVMPLLEYYYELWCSRAPATGFSRDGLWHNGVGYMSANILTLAYMPKLLSYVARFDFLSHPWYRNAGRALCYSCPTGSMGVGFGDQSEKFTTTNRQYPAFADFLAAETGDAIAGWYASQNAALVADDYELRIFRMTRPSAGYSGSAPDAVAGMAIYADAGEVAIHSNILDTGSDLAMAFRSSGFGSGSHTTASQNAFNIYYGGSPVFHSSGYYQNFSDAHNLMSYRHTRAHNSILINGIGQPYTTKAYGSMVRAGGGATISYALGDASNAYCGVTDDPMWLKAFEAAGIEQTPANGFGPTPLTRYRRHVAMLEGGIVLIYDELEASEAADWEWLLHSDTEFAIDDAESRASVETTNARSEVTLFSGAQLGLSQTNEFAVAPAIRDARYPDQWHFTAGASQAPALRILAVVATAPRDGDIPKPVREGGSIRIGDWEVKAELDASRKPMLTAVNAVAGTRLEYGVDSNSTLIADRVGGKIKVMELKDETPANSRASE